MAQQLSALTRQTLTKLPEQKLKLILHVGTPKTGTTSLQTYLDKKQRKLRAKGVLYPHNLETLPNPDTPKHQWFEKNLVNIHLENFAANFQNIIAQVKPETHTIILSSEGIYNYWWDFSESSKDLLSQMTSLFDIQVWVWFREPLAFIESYYKQCIRNPQVASNPCYGKDLSLAQMLDIEWFAQHLDYQRFVDECQNVFGTGNIRVFDYRGDVVQQVSEFFGLSTPHDNPTPRKNISLNAATADMIRVINRTQVKPKDKELLIAHLKQINRVLDNYNNVSLFDEEVRSKVLRLAKPVDSKLFY
nr:sulfotransferase family protein [Paraglaciecola sp. G1-23]